MGPLNEHNHLYQKPQTGDYFFKKPTILFVGEAVTAAHVWRPLALARGLDSNKWDIHFACDSRYKNTVERAGLQWHSLPSIEPEPFLQRLTSGKPAYTQEDLHAYIKDEKELLKKINPDLVVADFRISLSTSCALTKVRLVTLANAQWSPYATNPVPLPELPPSKILGTRIMKFIIGKVQPSIFAYHCRTYNKVREHYGLTPLNSLEDFYTTGDKTLYMDIPELFDHKKIPAHHHFIGPVHGTPNTELPEWWNKLPKNKPVIFISPGSSGSTKSIYSIIQVLSKMDLVVMVATAGRMSELSQYKNIYKTDYLPGPQAVKRADLVICNGGSGMVYLALAAGKPIFKYSCTDGPILRGRSRTKKTGRPSHQI